MAHEITKTDGLVLAKNRAWHGLGTVVENAPSIGDALQLAGLNWKCGQAPLFARRPAGLDGQAVSMSIDSHVENFREDTGETLGIVGRDWVPIQNSELAEFAAAVVDNSDGLKIETAGSIRGGRKVWFLLQGATFEIQGTRGDAVAPYLLLSNGFDGFTSMRATPTTIRVVCSNTLHAVIPQRENRSSVRSAAFVARHTANVAERVEEARQAIGAFMRGIDETRELANFLSSREASRADVQRFFLEAYSRDFGAIPSNPKNAREETTKTKAQTAFLAMARRFESEAPTAGANWWNVFNAYSGMLQHDKPIRGESKNREARFSSNVFGINADRTGDAFALALNMAS